MFFFQLFSSFLDAKSVCLLQSLSFGERLSSCCIVYLCPTRPLEIVLQTVVLRLMIVMVLVVTKKNWEGGGGTTQSIFSRSEGCSYFDQFVSICRFKQNQCIGDTTPPSQVNVIYQFDHFFPKE